MPSSNLQAPWSHLGPALASRLISAPIIGSGGTWATPQTAVFVLQSEAVALQDLLPSLLAVS